MIYTYTFNKKNTRNNPSSNNASKGIDALILSNLKKTAPYIFGAKDYDEEEIIILPKTKKEKKTIKIDITTSKSTPKKPSFDEFAKAFFYLMGKNGNADTYDFKLDDGTPIKMYDDEIQIGLDLIPLNNASKRIYDMLSDSRKKEIIDIYIKIKK